MRHPHVEPRYSMVLAERYAGMKQPRKEKKEEKKMCV
jgi:hypothetical protein